MACKYTYNGQTYTKDEFYSLVRTTMVQPKTVQKYNKILFPTGNTASKVEGHTTLEEFKKEKEDRIKELEKQKENGIKIVERYLTDEAGEPYTSVDVKIDEEINQLKQELERVNAEGFGALKPIYNFYENVVKNILKKNYPINQIIDEYGNTWNEIEINLKRDTSPILAKINKDDGFVGKKDVSLKERIFNNKNSESLINVLNNIKNNSNNENFKLLASYLLQSNNVPNIKINLIDTKLLSNNAVGLYHSAYLTKDLFNSSPYIEIAKNADFRLGNGESTILHEILHALSFDKLRDGSQLSQDFIKLYEYAKSIVKEEHYGLTDYDEFITELFTNGNFIKTLSKYPSSGNVKYKNLFEEIIAKILQFFNITNDSLYEEAVSIASQLLKNNNVSQLYSFEETLLYNIDNSTNKENTEFSEFLSKDTKNQEVFIKFIKDIKSKLDNYIELVQDGKVDYPSTKKEIKLSELKAIKKLLNNSDLEDSIIGINNVITQSVNWIDIINDEFFGSNNLLTEYNNLKNQDLDLLSNEELIKRDEKIAFITKSLNKSKHFLYLFDTLEEFHNELKRNGFIASDKFNTKLRDKDLFFNELRKLNIEEDVIIQNYELLNSNGVDIISLKESVINDHFLNNTSVTLSDYFKFKKDLDEVFKNNVDKTFNAQMDYALQKASNIKKELKDLHYKITAEWLFPDYDKIQKNLNLKEKDTLYLTKDQFTTLIKIGESDENIISNWLEATIQSKDPVVSIIANKIAKAINKGHQNSFLDADIITKARNKSGFNNLSNKDRSKEYDNMTNMITVLVEDNYGRPIEIELNDEREGLEIETLHGKRKYLTKKVKAFKTGKHTSLASAQKKLINTILYNDKNENEKGILKDLYEKAIDKDGNLDPISLNNYLKSKGGDLSYLIRQSIFKTNLEGNVLENPVRFIEILESLKGDDFKRMFKTKIKNIILKKLYYDKVEKSKTSEELYDLFISKNIDIFNLSKDEKVYILENSNLNDDVEGFKFKIKNNIATENILSVKKDNITYYAYLTKSNELKFDKFKDIDFDNVESFMYKKLEFTDLTDAYKLPEYKGQYEEYFSELYKVYQQKNKVLGNQRLKHGIIPQIEATGMNFEEIPKEAKSFLSSIYDWFKDNYINFKKEILKLEKDKNENEEEKKLFEQQYLNGEKVKSVSIKHTTLLENQDKLEKDLSVSLLAYSSSVNTYQSLKQYDSNIQLLRTVIAGDTLLNINRREFKKRDNLGNIISRFKGIDNEKFAKSLSDNLNKKILEFIDDIVYGEGEYSSFDLGVFNSNQFEKVASGYTAYTSLAFNVLGSMSNIMNGKVSTYLESIQSEHFDKSIWLESEKEYRKNLHLHFADYKEDVLSKKSKIGQLAILLDAIQGEYLDSFDEQLRKKKFSDIPKSALFFTQSAPEHYIQLVNMIAMLKGSKNKEGVSLWDRIKYKKGETINFKDLSDELIKFQGKLHSVNKRLNGAYSKIDKSRLQRRWFGRLALTFRKYIYQSFKTRFGNERIDFESGDLVRGYVNSYYSELFEDLKSNRGFAYKALRTFEQVGTDTKRFGLGTLNTLTLGTLRKNVNLDKLMGIDNLDERKRKEAQRYIAEVSLYTTFTFIGILLSALADDDDKSLKLLELLAKRQKSDMGAFLPTMVNIPTGDIIPGFSSWDFTRRLVSSSIPAMRVYDNSVNLLSQLIGVDYTDEGVNFTINDKYDRKGYGYEKGDLKINRLAQKSIFSFYWQILKLLNPEQQLKYLDMVNKNSK